MLGVLTRGVPPVPGDDFRCAWDQAYLGRILGVKEKQTSFFVLFGFVLVREHFGKRIPI